MSTPLKPLCDDVVLKILEYTSIDKNQIMNDWMYIFDLIDLNNEYISKKNNETIQENLIFLQESKQLSEKLSKLKLKHEEIIRKKIFNIFTGRK